MSFASMQCLLSSWLYLSYAGTIFINGGDVSVVLFTNTKEECTCLFKSSAVKVGWDCDNRPRRFWCCSDGGLRRSPVTPGVAFQEHSSCDLLSSQVSSRSSQPTSRLGMTATILFPSFVQLSITPYCFLGLLFLLFPSFLLLFNLIAFLLLLDFHGLIVFSLLLTPFRSFLTNPSRDQSRRHGRGFVRPSFCAVCVR